MMIWLKQSFPNLHTLGVSPHLTLIWCDHPSWSAFILESMMCLLPCPLCWAEWVILAEVKIVCQTNCVPDTKMTFVTWRSNLELFCRHLRMWDSSRVHLVTSDMPGPPPKYDMKLRTAAPTSIIWVQQTFFDHCARSSFLKGRIHSYFLEEFTVQGLLKQMSSKDVPNAIIEICIGCFLVSRKGSKERGPWVQPGILGKQSWGWRCWAAASGRLGGNKAKEQTGCPAAWTVGAEVPASFKVPCIITSWERGPKLMGCQR